MALTTLIDKLAYKYLGLKHILTAILPRTASSTRSSQRRLG